MLTTRGEGGEGRSGVRREDEERRDRVESGTSLGDEGGGLREQQLGEAEDPAGGGGRGTGWG